MVTVLNAFSFNMIPATFGGGDITFTEISADSAGYFCASFAEVHSAVGHVDTARLFSVLLGVEIPMNRVNVEVEPGESYLLGQYSGPRLPEGATVLPEGATIRWFMLRIT